MSRYFRLNIATLLSVLESVVKQLQERAAEKLEAAKANDDAAQVLIGQAASQRNEAKVAMNLADKVTRLLS